MQAKEENIIVNKTARYFTLGNPKNAKRIWIVFHGYGQLAKYFIHNFSHLDPEENYIVAPEGFYRFYLNGFDGRVGATWMTKESRLTDISDYVGFINSVFETAIKPYYSSEKQMIAFGFSQGVATIARWIAYGNFRPDQLVLWAGSFPPDLEPAKARKSFDAIPTICCVGDRDPFVKQKHLLDTKAHLQALDIIPDIFPYSGEHKIPSGELGRLIETFIN